MKIGIVGGIGPESTIDYYKKIISSYRTIITDGSYPEIVINSIDMNKMIKIMMRSAWDELCCELSKALDQLQGAGADIAIIASNTPHVVFDRVKNSCPIPLISIVDATSENIFQKGCRKAGLLGTGFTMKQHFYQDVLIKYGIEAVVPSDLQQEYIHEKLFSEIELGVIKDSTKRELVEIVHSMIGVSQIDGLILGCTELPMIISQKDFSIPVFDTVELHVKKVVEIITAAKK
jgi:aspartate racemase